MFLWKASGVFNPVLATKSKWVISLVGNCFFPHMSDNSKYVKYIVSSILEFIYFEIWGLVRCPDLSA